MLDNILGLFGLCRLSLHEKLYLDYYDLSCRHVDALEALAKAQKNDHRDERGRFKKAPK